MALLEGSASKSDDDDKVVQGNITLKSEGDGSEVSVDAGRYISDLKREVEQLRAEMAAMKQVLATPSSLLTSAATRPLINVPRDQTSMTTQILSSGPSKRSHQTIPGG